MLFLFFKIILAMACPLYFHMIFALTVYVCKAVSWDLDRKYAGPIDKFGEY